MSIRTIQKHCVMEHNHAGYNRRLDFIQSQVSRWFSLEDIEICHTYPPWDTSTEETEPALVLMLSKTQDIQITPLQYDPGCPFEYNNFVYRLTLPFPISNSQANISNDQESRQPDTLPIPPGISEFFVRLTNANADRMKTQNRVENEVAAITLASAALDYSNPRVVSRIYGWGSAISPVSQSLIFLAPLSPPQTTQKEKSSHHHPLHTIA